MFRVESPVTDSQYLYKSPNRENLSHRNENVKSS